MVGKEKKKGVKKVEGANPNGGNGGNGKGFRLVAPSNPRRSGRKASVQVVVKVGNGWVIEAVDRSRTMDEDTLKATVEKLAGHYRELVPGLQEVIRNMGYSEDVVERASQPNRFSVWRKGERILFRMYNRGSPKETPRRVGLIFDPATLKAEILINKG